MNNFKKRLPRIVRMIALMLLAACGGWQLSDYSNLSPDHVQYFPYTDQDGELTVCLNHQGADVQLRAYSQAECIMFLKADLKPVYDAMNALLNTPLTEEQKNALAVFMFSAGSGAVLTPRSNQTLNDDVLLIPGIPSGL